LSKIRTMCWALIGELQEAISELTFGCSVPSIDLGSIVEKHGMGPGIPAQALHCRKHLRIRPGHYGYKARL
jgi:hypothetical protein